EPHGEGAGGRGARVAHAIGDGERTAGGAGGRHGERGHREVRTVEADRDGAGGGRRVVGLVRLHDLAERVHERDDVVARGRGGIDRDGDGRHRAVGGAGGQAAD